MATKRLLAALVVAVFVLQIEASPYVLGVKRAAGGGGGGTPNLLDETFTNVVGGYSSSGWTEAGSSGTVDEDETASCGTGTGWAGDCLEVVGAVFDDRTTRNALSGAQTGDVWARLRLKPAWTIASDGNGFAFWTLSTAAGSSVDGSINLRVVRTAGPVYSFDLHTFHSGGARLSLDTATAVSGTQVCIEVYFNNSTNAWQWWINGAQEGPASPTESLLTVDPTNLWLGLLSGVPSGESWSAYYDQVQLSSTGRLACD